MSFEWQTEEEVDWDVPEESLPTPRPPRPQRRWFRALLVLAIIVVVSGMVAYRELFRRVEVGTENVEADVLASYAVVQTAIREQDNDLLATFMSGADFEWVQALDEMVANGRFYDRSSLYLHYLQASAVPTPTLTLSDDLREAELTSTHTYAFEIGHGITETVTLVETAVYRQGPNRWLIAPPKSAFWGQSQTTSGEIFTLSYPGRDAEIAQRLALDIDAKLLELCANFAGMNCPDDFEVHLTLTTNPEWLHAPAEIQSYWLPLEGMRLTSMPTPTLIGLPVDEAGYQVLYRGYAAQVVTAVVSGLLDASCCRYEVLYQAALADLLARLSLQPWPAAADYQQFMLNPVGWSDLQTIWQQERPFPQPVDDWAAYALVDYVVNELGLMNSTAFLRSVVAFAERPYADWIQTIMAPLQSNQLPQQAWVHFLNEQAGLSQPAPPAPQPNQALYLTCEDSQADWSLVRYDVRADQFTYLSRAVTGPAFLHGLKDDVGVIVGEDAASRSSSRLFLWAGGQKTEISWPRTEATPGVIPIISDPTEQRVLLSGYPGNIAPFGVFPASSCLGGDACDIEVADGFVTWSPDGTQAIIAANDDALDDVRLETLLFLGNGQGGIPELSADSSQLGRLLGTGSVPFWLDSSRFGFVQFNVQMGSSGVFVGDVRGGEPTLLFTAAELTSMLPAAAQNQQTRIDNIVIHPRDPATLLVATADSLLGEGTAHLFTYNVVDGGVELLFSFLPEPTSVRRGYRVSPNGRFLAITSLLRSSSDWMLYLHDLQTGKTHSFALGKQYQLPPHLYLDWSDDGNWLSIITDGYVHLIHQASGYERIAVSPVLNCSSAAWVDDSAP
ncbi:MAG: hypothetical protein KC419_05865 [Anaerolineales bacterium]|nr:hypothetical protein [Anaerolineales bacterium]